MSSESTKSLEEGVAAMNVATKEELEWPVERVRSCFIKYFTDKNDHTFWPSSPCVPHDDPTLLFTNAGMNQYKPLFLGTCDPDLEMSTLKRAVNSQKCIRAGGKHNDLDEVGYDTYHHTFFEMLGNWSFGDYFKKEAIDMAWICLTEVFKLDKDRLYATYFEGNDNCPVDTEAREFWLQYLPQGRVIACDAKDNFWEMGATGPCGPCTEIHYDRIGNRDASSLVNADLPEVIEIWNNVFIQYNREPSGELRPLPHKHVDTGMGLERLTSILQNVDSNYDTDIFLPIFDALYKTISEQKGGLPDGFVLPKYEGKVGKTDTEGVDMAYRVIGDHIRTLSFAIADGATPDKDGRGYVLRRILRRAVRYGRSNLHAEIGFFAKLVPVVVQLMGTAFPELVKHEARITAVIKSEEESFGQTLDKGLTKFDQFAKLSKNGVFSGEDAHILYTSMGFPVDLTELMAEERGLKLDKNEFEQKMKTEQELSSKALEEKKLKMSGGIDMKLEAEQTAYLSDELKAKVTDDGPKYEKAPGLEAEVIALYLGRNATDKYGFVDSVNAEDSSMIGVILSTTQFYAESGGQVADTGSLVVNSTDTRMKIENAQSYAGYIVHSGPLLSGSLQVGAKVQLDVDYDRRLEIASNHTMTHVLNLALRDVLVLSPDDGSKKMDGQQMDQRGSLVDENKLRFDFSWSGPLTESQLARVETICQERIRFAIPVESFVAPLVDAQKISSLRAVFGETYPDPVRVVSIAPIPLQDILSAPEKNDWMEYSVEFCGGTHLKNTSEAQEFILLNEEGIAKGVRRIEAVTMEHARRAIAAEKELDEKISNADKLNGDELEKEIKLLTLALNTAAISASSKMRMRQTLGGLSKRAVAWKKEEAAKRTKIVLETVIEAASSTSLPGAICRSDFGTDGKAAKAVMTGYGKKVKDKAFLLVSADMENNRFMVCAFSPKQFKEVDCKAWVAAATDGTGAKGGGKKDSAQSTVSGVEKIEQVLEKARLFFD
mmetsp:Transcript_25740/g.38033  ORF Transcript_25740/g.38033 Transcript_25740/m.38033 type:complete len:998 (+) Transcript_25740:104-3097(+)|eukprot:CAMPEP_0195518762 /NCGR_PEP_ID=MMETSP0794_2-20130614/13618_1 /TAXON_ID=515487 /ORGANISM="Stephanopyxis turris, Strain CCMP 815" /LENGTH=997 /DNA_ID=CAMNT_0040647783 /DNA_START=99 /DNA_END=3092 /DNA_ORIENTATION=+